MKLQCYYKLKNNYNKKEYLRKNLMENYIQKYLYINNK